MRKYFSFSNRWINVDEMDKRKNFLLSLKDKFMRKISIASIAESKILKWRIFLIDFIFKRIEVEEKQSK